MKKLTLAAMSLSIRDDLNYAKRRLASLNSNKDLIKSDLRIANQIAGANDVHGYLNCGSLFATVRLEVSSFKDDDNLIETLERCCELRAKESSDYVTEWCAERCYNFDLPFGGHIRIEARLNGEAQNCQKVQVGVELKEVPTYEIRCN